MHCILHCRRGGRGRLDAPRGTPTSQSDHKCPQTHFWVSDFTYVQTWNGMVYVAFVIDVFARRIVGWKVSTSMTTQFVLHVLEQAIWQRKPAGNKALIYHSDRGSQYLSIRYTALADIDASVGTVCDSYDNALAETINGLYKAEVIHHLGPWKSMAQVEWKTLRLVDWYNN
ncbi:DDE-type integrase/transposase/recombinase [Acetobacter sp. TBRC 12305]|uniref:DDE-type integrase/transposase/recombinase n=1 Tax=Acetobacter garciniae TaxID=2817435 RepID=A0A939HQK1_9PROT|nr:DDE-type integrase/transposase/recombinase [Acetobacter garciniae]MBX0346396.1 DDE-type integrase/transposase/recombinase [Acetobacter garciniae]